MGRMILAIVVVFALPRVTTAQPIETLAPDDADTIWPNPPWCQTCYVKANVDIPSTRTPPGEWSGKAMKQQRFGIAGWAYMCHSGQLPDQFTISYFDDDGRLVVIRHEQLDVHLWLPRGDVYKATSSECPGARPDAGFALMPRVKLPRGPRKIYVHMWVGGIYAKNVRHVTIY